MTRGEFLAYSIGMFIIGILFYSFVVSFEYSDKVCIPKIHTEQHVTLDDGRKCVITDDISIKCAE